MVSLWIKLAKLAGVAFILAFIVADVSGSVFEGAKIFGFILLCFFMLDEQTVKGLMTEAQNETDSLDFSSLLIIRLVAILFISAIFGGVVAEIFAA